jgi:hypothetical protein
MAVKLNDKVFRFEDIREALAWWASNPKSTLVFEV